MTPAAETTTSSTASTMIAASVTAPSSDKACKRWGPPCPFCAQSVLHSSPVDSDWSEEDWDGDIEREKKNKERKRRQGKDRKIEEQEKISNYYPPSPIYDSHPEEKILPHLTPQQKIELEPNYYPQTTSLN